MITTLEGNQDTILVSSLVLLECAEVIKKRIAEAENFVGINDQVKTKIENESNSKLGQFMNKITLLAMSNKVLLVDPDWNVKKYFMDAFNIFRSNFGDLKESNYCFRCKRQTSSRYGLIHVGFWDILHALNAQEFSADEIISADKGFNSIGNVGQFNSIQITVL